MARSPSVQILEQDKSTYTVTTSDSSVAIVGYATNGPIGEAVVCISKQDFISKFGEVPSTAPWGHLAAYHAFSQGASVVYKRVAEEDGSAVATRAEKVITDAEPADASYQKFARASSLSFYENGTMYTFDLTAGGAGPNTIAIDSPAGGSWSLGAIASSIKNQLGATRSFIDLPDPATVSTKTIYKFKFTMNGSTYPSSGQYFLTVNPSDDITTIKNNLKAAIQRGGRSYHAIATTDTNISASSEAGTNSEVTGGATFGLSINGGTEQIITVTSPDSYNLDANETIGNIITGINTALQEQAGGRVECYMFYSATAPKIVFVSTSFDDSIAISLGTLFSTSNILSAATTFTGNISFQDTSASTGEVDVSVIDTTGRIRITAPVSLAGDTDPITFAAGTANTGTDVWSASGSLFDSDDDLLINGHAAMGATCSIGSDGKIIITNTATGTNAVTIAAPTYGSYSLATLLGTDTAHTGSTGETRSTASNFLVYSKQKGSYCNNISVVKSSTTNPVDDTTVHSINVYLGDTLEKTYTDVSLDEDSTDFFVDLINADESNGGSSLVNIDADYIIGSGDGTILNFPDGTYYLGVANGTVYAGGTIDTYDYRIGTDGIPTSGGSELFVEALDSSGDLSNKEVFDFLYLLTPDNHEEETQAAAITLVEGRGDCIYLVDSPFGLEYDEVKDWHNGVGGYGRSTALNSSYAALYWPWQKDYNPATEQYLFCPPSVYLVAKHLEIDRVYGAWYAAAGDTRGKINSIDTETSPSKAQRDALYGDFNAVNPIVNYPTKGMIIYGQKTLVRTTSATNRLTVRKMVCKVKKLVKQAMESMLFEPNVPDSWRRATTMINSILEPIKQSNGLDAYKVVIDSTTNTADVIAQNMMIGTIQLVPVGTIEVIDLSLSISQVGATVE